MVQKMSKKFETQEDLKNYFDKLKKLLLINHFLNHLKTILMKIIVIEKQENKKWWEVRASEYEELKKISNNNKWL